MATLIRQDPIRQDRAEPSTENGCRQQAPNEQKVTDGRTPAVDSRGPVRAPDQTYEEVFSLYIELL